MKVQIYESRGMKNAIDKIGETNLEITEPLDMNSQMGKFLTRAAPIIYHIAFGVDEIENAANNRADKGNKIMGEDSLIKGSEGYLTVNIDPEGSQGFPF